MIEKNLRSNPAEFDNSELDQIYSDIMINYKNNMQNINEEKIQLCE